MLKFYKRHFSDTTLARATTSDTAPGSKKVNTKKWLCVSVHTEEAGIIELERLWLSHSPPSEINSRPSVTTHIPITVRY